jgi:hypothetical protein
MMAIFNLFSKRAKALREELPDVYQYDEIPQTLRVQIVHIVRDAFGNAGLFDSKTTEYLKLIYDTLCREYGVFALSKDASRRGPDYASDLYNHFLNEPDIEKALDFVELSFRVIDNFCRDWDFVNYSSPNINPDDAIKELNARMRYHGVGYQYESGELIRVDSQLVHQEAVKPVLSVLRGKGFEGANEEMLKAFEHYRHGRHKEALNEALKAFESTMKALCKINNWTFNPNDTASKLIDHCMNNGLFPEYLKSHYSSLAAGLKSGVPTIRNREGGHGQGDTKTVVPDYLVAYHLHITASSILMIVSANNCLQATAKRRA